jgi:NAD(P)-dependent dehydrogenase (short-subunit alcohol dehydrogenase family)
MSANQIPEESNLFQASANGSAHEISIIPLQREETEHQQETKKVDLHGKVALIVGGATEKGQSLAVAFAERGVDVALVYFNEDHARAAQIKREVEQRQQACMLVAGRDRDEDADTAFAGEVMLQILQRFGRLDIFINLSSRAFPLGDLLGGDEDQIEALRSRIFPHFNIMKAALDQITS